MGQEIDSDNDATMLASNAFHGILSQIQSSNLNFQLQISPFAALISLKKALGKDKSGTYLRPPIPVLHNDNFENILARNSELEKNILDLQKNYEKVAINCTKAYESLQNTEAENELLKKAINDKDIMLENIKSDSLLIQNKLEKAENELVNLFAEAEEKESKLTNNIYALEADIKEYRETSLKYESDISEARENKKSLEVKIQSQEVIICSLNDKIETKEVELKANIEEKRKLEKKVTDLLDVLYGCPECGLNDCECKEDDYSIGDEKSIENSDMELSMILPPTVTPETLSASLPPPPSCGSLPWTPPPTPPCTNCGGLNFGPSPSSVCFPCLPPLLSTSEPCPESPSRTPPGTPPPPLPRSKGKHDQQT